MQNQGFTAYRKLSQGWRPVVQATVVAMFTVAAQMVLTFPSSAEAQHLPMAEPESVGMSSKRLERLDAAMQRYIDADMIAGTVTLVARKGEVIHLKAQGHRYIEGSDPMPTDAIFVIMSMTKPIVSTALMMLFEEGYFLLDDPISKYMPEYADMEVLVETEGGVRRVQSDRPITFRHVLSHTAGVDPSRDLLSEDEQAIPRRAPTLEETLVGRAQLPLAFHPGDEWRYGSSTDYVALLVERISGQRLDRFLQERIFEPLGMVDTHYNVPASKVDRVAAVYSPSGPGSTIELRSEPSFFRSVSRSAIAMSPTMAGSLCVIWKARWQSRHRAMPHRLSSYGWQSERN